MVRANVIELGIDGVHRCIKVDDAVSCITVGLNADNGP